MFALLSFIGLLVLTTASVHFSDSLYGNPTHILNKQLFHLFLGFFLLITVFLIPLTFWEQFDRWLLALGILLLILVFIPGVGVEVNGANRWIRIFGFSLQPSEIMKFLIILYISAYCVRRSDEVRSDLLSFVRPSILLVSIISLILIQPDLGT